MSTRASARQKYQTPIKLFDRVCKELLGVWVVGKISAIKHSKKGNSKVLVSRYVLEFDDNEGTQIECGYEQVVDMVAKFQERKNIAPTSPRHCRDTTPEHNTATFYCGICNIEFVES